MTRYALTDLGWTPFFADQLADLPPDEDEERVPMRVASVAAQQGLGIL